MSSDIIRFSQRGGDRAAAGPRVAALLLAPLFVSLSLLAVPASASATLPSGALAQLSSPFNCVSEKVVSPGCGTLLPRGVNNTYQAQVSPDGRNVYSVAIGGDLVEYSRNPATGGLTVIGCLTETTEPCAPEHVTTEAVAMNGPAAVAISPDGKNVYVVTQGTNAVVEFSRRPETGLLTEMGIGHNQCISHEASSPCLTNEAKGMNLPYGITVSPDGKNVYVASYSDEAVAEFSRNTETGVLTQLSSPNNCVSSTPLSGCGAPEDGHALERAIGVAISPDGKNVYVAAGATIGEGDIAAFERDTGEEGALKPLAGERACVSSYLLPPECTEVNYLNGTEDLAISPDGKNIYANSFDEGAVVELQRNESTGALTQLAGPNECVMTESTKEGCSLGRGIAGALGVAISPDGDNLYASGSGESAEAAFARNTATGALTQLAAPRECVTSSSSGCGAIEAVGLRGARRVTVSPDGTNVYLAGQSSSAIVELSRTITPAVFALSPDTGSEAGGTIVQISGSGFAAGASVDFGPTLASSVTVNSAGSISAISPPGSGIADVTVTNAAGTSVITAADRFSYIHPTSVASEPEPVLASTGNLAPISGRVLVRLPGTKAFVPLNSVKQVPFGTVVDATHGRVKVTAATPGGGTETGEFFGGEFRLTQNRSGLVIATLTGGDFSVCGRHMPSVRRDPARASSRRASAKHVVGKLWADAHGHFSTRGHYAAGAVQGTEWLTEDLCEGTLIRVTRDRVAVTDLVRHRHVEVRAGHSYLAKAP
jgi:sugar lactone lactonase YvrE